jgi:uncharacterized protein
VAPSPVRSGEPGCHRHAAGDCPRSRAVARRAGADAGAGSRGRKVGCVVRCRGGLLRRGRRCHPRHPAVPARRPCRRAHVAGVAYQTVVRVPVGTVLWEEVAFRWVLLASFSRVLSTPGAIATTSALFGVWHIRPTLDALRINQAAAGPVRTTAAVAASVAITALTGALLTGLRRRTGSRLAPALVHVAANPAALRPELRNRADRRSSDRRRTRARRRTPDGPCATETQAWSRTGCGP